MQKKERVRIFALARELNMETKDLLVLCQEHGLDIRNQLSTIEPEQRDQILELVKRGSGQTPSQPAAAPVPAPSPAPVVPTRVIVNLDQRRPAPAKASPHSGSPVPKSEPDHPPVVPPPSAPVVPTPVVAVPPKPVPAAQPTPTTQPAPAAQPVPPVQPATAKQSSVAPTPKAAAPSATPPVAVPKESPSIPALKSAPPVVPAPPAPKAPEQVAPAATAKPAEPPVARPAAPQAQPPRPPQGTQPVRPSTPEPRPIQPVRPTPTSNAPPMRQMGSAPRPITGQAPRPGGNPPAQGQPAPGSPPAQGDGGQQRDRRPLRPGQRVGNTYRVTSAPAGQNPPRPAPPSPLNKQPVKPTGPVKLASVTPEMLAQMQGTGRDTPITVKDVENHIRQQNQPPRAATPPTGGAAAPGAPQSEFDEDGKRRDAGGVPGRADRHKERSDRRARRDVPGTDSRGKVNTATLLDDEGPRYRSSRPIKKPKPPGTLQRKGKTPISLPITVRTFSEAVGRKVGEVVFKLMGHGLSPSTNINSAIEPDLAELLALEYGCELDIKRDVDVEQAMLDIHDIKSAPEDLVSRAPIVAVMGHVDHGKTSLLDRIREAYGVKSDVVSTEAGGITQVLRAWRVSKDGKPITFLDTPGHEAFTKMRARGANVTDIAVIVVAANDGVMPQTEEAISHSKAAGVKIVVAINKVDLPDSNLRKTEQQLYGLGLIPDNMGGDVPFILTSAKTGKGIDQLLEAISVVAELEELSANPSKPASGTCLEAYLSEREGVQATLLVQDGTLRTGDIVLCGACYGTIRRMYDDIGRVTEEAGPSLPVRILGLDHVPNADDTFHVVEELSNAREIAEGRRALLMQKSQKTATRLTLDTLKDAQIVELKIILKAEARGSVEAIRNELEKLRHDEVRVRVLHAAIGGITASDVQLALTSPEDTLIVGFNVVPDSEARALAEEKGIQINQYDIIYKLADDIRAALEGKLKPREEIVYLGRANVRNTFKISRVGTIAGCFVTQGVMERSAKIRVVRNGLVVYPPPDRTAGLETLKRFKDDVREVREGFECGIKIAGYDDIKVDDAIECYRIEHVKRTLN